MDSIWDLLCKNAGSKEARNPNTANWTQERKSINTAGILCNVKSTHMVVAIASCFKPTAKDRIEFIRQYVEPAFGEKRVL